MKKDFLHLTDWDAKKLQEMLERALILKQETLAGRTAQPLKGRIMGMLFTKPSLRTRVSFEAGMRQLGGHALYISPQEVGIGKREAAEDVARVLSGYVDLIMARLHGHQTLLTLANYASKPVINGLTDYNHPCQVFSDLLTILEKKGRIEGLKVAYIGDGNNLCVSWLNAATLAQFTLAMAVPEGFGPDPSTLERAARLAGDRVRLLRDPREAVADADVVYTDVWTSMGQEEERRERLIAFKGYTLDKGLLELARPDAIVMHCLPAHRGEEITHEVLESDRSVVFDQAENRLHGQKAVILDVMDAV